MVISAGLVCLFFYEKVVPFSLVLIRIVLSSIPGLRFHKNPNGCVGSMLY